MGYKFWKYARRVDADAMDLYSPNGAKLMRIKNNAGESMTYIYGKSTSGHIRIGDTGSSIRLMNSNSALIDIYEDLLLTPKAGSYVKFGTKTATGDVVCDGHLDIKDAAGNVVKLMTTA